MAASTNEAVTAALAGSNGFTLISDEKLLHLYATMLKCRMITERAPALNEQSRLTGNGAPGGKEAAAAGVAVDLLPEDTIAVSRRDDVVNFIKGIPLEMILGARSSCAAQPNLDAQLMLAMGVALDNKRKKNGKITVVFCDDVSASSGFWHEVLSVAGAEQLPILFVCQKNSLAGSPHCRKRTDIAENAINVDGCGFPVIAVDGNDVVAVYRVATESIAHARKGNGPTLIECWGERSKPHDPIRKMESYLKRKGLFSEEIKFEVAAAFTSQLDAAAKAVETSLSRSISN